MERAAVLIGVKKAGDLPELQAVGSGVQRMAEWARAQGIPDDQLKILTDDKGPLRAHQIADTVEALVKLRTIEQLIVYFSGHGIHNRGERWLLSRAPSQTGEAINVEGSVLLARNCGIPHVVMISDACRTAADGIQALQVTGTDVFPNDPTSGLEQPVDVFFACARGSPALEVRNPIESAGNFYALYTEVLAECLRGEHEQTVDYVVDDGAEVGLVRPWKLQDYLREVVPRRLKEKLGRTPRINQMPDARINSREAWLSRLLLDPTRAGGAALNKAGLPQGWAKTVTPFNVSNALIASALAGDKTRWQQVLGGTADGDDVSLLKRSVGILATTFGPLHYETRCGFKIRGAQVRAAYGKGVGITILDAEGTLVRVDPGQGNGASVLLVLADGTGAVVPAVRDFLAELTFEDGALTDVSFEPAETAARWNDYVLQRDDLRALRASIAAAANMGMFHLTAGSAPKLALRMEMSKGFNPSMAVYAAYAYHDLQRADLIRQMRMSMLHDLHMSFFDLDLLGGMAAALHPPPNLTVPPFPLLSQGWSLLSAFRARMPNALRGLEQHLLPSLWTLFDPKGVDKLIEAISDGEIQ